MIKQSGNIFIIIVFLCLLILVAGGAYYLGSQNKFPNQDSPPGVNIYKASSQQDITSNSNKTIEVYSNKKYSYTLGLPQEMKLVQENYPNDSSVNFTNFNSSDFEIDKSACQGGCSYPVKKGESLQVVVQENWQSGFDINIFKESPPLKLPGVLYQEEKTINGIKMLITERTRVDMPDLGNTDWYADFVHQGNWYRIILSTDNSQKESSKSSFLSTLSTFKFNN